MICVIFVIMLVSISKILVVVEASSSTTTTTTTTSAEMWKSVASKYKAPNDRTPKELKEKWKIEDERLWSYVEKNVPAVLNHTGSAAFDEHLKGVQAILRYWNASDYLTKAGLFHSIYGTEGFQGFSLPLSERPTIQKLIGNKAEKLCFIFCMVDRLTVDETVFNWNDGDNEESNKDNTNGGNEKEIIYATFKSRPELGRFIIELNKDEWIDFIELTLVDWLEQVEGASLKSSPNVFNWNFGEAYAYRRSAYEKMAIILSKEKSTRIRLGNLPIEMLNDVYSTESNTTKHLVQTRTPPMSIAAKDAYNALRSIGEDIPEESFYPQPILLQQSGGVENENDSKKDEL